MTELPTLYQSFIHLSRYSRWLDDKGRRETWEETVTRYMEFMKWHLHENCKYKMPQTIYDEVKEYILNLKSVPAMRCLMTAGEALKRENLCGYNCSGQFADRIRSLDEMLYILMNGVGGGFTVENKFIQKFPVMAEQFDDTDTVIIVKDSKAGWAKAFKELLSLLTVGQIPKWDLSKIRPKGSRLKVFGGRACLTGDTILYKDRKKSEKANTITIKELFDMERSQGFWTKKPNHFDQVKIRSLNEETGEFYRNNVITVIKNGMAPVYNIITKNGYNIRATGNHRFMKECGMYARISDFKIGEGIAVNGSEERKTGICIDCNCSISRRAIRCLLCYNKHQIIGDTVSGTTARQRKECREYKKDYCEYCKKVNTRFEIHHIDENPYNNNHDNLQNLCCLCHQREHAKRRTFPNSYSHKYLSFDNIISIESVGIEQVYDLQMEAPDHNFIANGFVSHNSGPEPLDRLFKYSVDVFQKAKGRKFTSFEIHLLFCVVANAVRVGGVRRAALSSLSDLTDDRMRNAKFGDWRKEYPDLALSNNSVCYTEKPNIGTFMEEWVSLYNSKSGERGIFNRTAAKNTIKKINEKAGRERRNVDHDFITNPCFEVILRDRELCNLSEVIVRPSDKLEELKGKVRVATIMGTWQASLTDFKYVSSKWAENCKEEALLGVSMTGIYDNSLTNGSQGEGKLIKLLEELNDYSIEVNKEWAKKININPAAAITCVKPSGNVSQLVDSSSGIHARHSEYYIRAVSLSKDDPMTRFMISKGFTSEPDLDNPDSIVRFLFPIKSPSKSLYRQDRTAIEQLELWMIYQKHWCEHKPSITVSVKEHEWLETGAWVYKNFDEISGVAFFPFSDHDFDQPVYQECTKKEYEEAEKVMPKDIDWTELSKFETDDNTVGSQELACSSAKGCEM